MLAWPRGSPGPGRSRRGPGAALPLRHDLARSALVPAGTRRGRRAGVGDDRLRRARPPRPLRECRRPPGGSRDSSPPARAGLPDGACTARGGASRPSREPGVPREAVARGGAAAGGRCGAPPADSVDGRVARSRRRPSIPSPGLPPRPHDDRRDRTDRAGGGARRHRALVRRLDRRRTEAGDRPAARATERPGATRGSRCDPRPGRRAAGRDDRRHPLEPRLLCARSRKSRPRRAFYATRLYRDLRERRGLVYHVGSSLQMTKTRGMIELEYACDPGNVARAIIERDLREMRRTPVRPEELVQARRLLLSNIPLGESSEEDIARGLLTRSAEDLPLDEPLRAAETLPPARCRRRRGGLPSLGA